MLNLPLWIVTEHIQPTGPEHTPENEPGTALAFSSSNKLFTFMNAHFSGEWKMEMADDRDGLAFSIADLHRLEISALELDPDVNGKWRQAVSASPCS